MEKENLISLSISQEDLQAIEQATKTLEEKLMPLLIQLSPAESKEINMMGDKTVAFVIKAYEFAVQNPDLTPKFMDTDEMKKDMDAVEILRRLINPLKQLVEFMEDTRRLAGSEALSEALIFYNAIKAASKAKIGASRLIYEELKQRYPGRNRKKEDESGSETEN